MSASGVGYNRIWAWRDDQGDVYTGEWAPEGDPHAPMEAGEFVFVDEVARLVGGARNDAMLACVSLVADLRNEHPAGPVFAALNEALGRIEAARFRSVRAAKGAE